jgi:hypothetical protein
VLVVGLALLLGGCVEKSNTGEGLPQQEANSVDELTVSAFGAMDMPSGMKEVRADDADLRGPHFAIDIDWIATGSMIKQKFTPSVSELTARRAADGQELLLVAVTGEQTNGQFTLGDRKAPIAELVVGSRKKLLTRLPLPPNDDDIVPQLPTDGVLLVASVPHDGKVELVVTDEGKAQSVDLRTGERSESIDGYYGSTAQPLAFDTAVPLTFAEGGGTQLQVTDHALAEFTDKVAVLAPWTPDQGWAPDEHAWLVIPRPVLSTPLSMDMTGLRLTFDDAVVFSVDGRPELGGAHTVETFSGEYTATTDPLVFDVPADFTGGTFTMNIAAMGVTAEYYTGDRVVTWAPPPAPFTVPLSFS